ncbi:MAG TPA: lipoyl(octanoyl) transferase LipB [Euzebyales bacterium]|nr:lipoyl(octanoyl) transferase LipB [Euzebyales bacterium]
MIAVECGRIAYERALRLQHDLAARRAADRVDDLLLVCEHPPVYTAGRHADTARNVLDAGRIPVVRADRGGDVTYHGPGQVVIYPIIRLTGPRRVRAYVGALEQACIDVAGSYGVHAHTVAGRPGVWVGDDKLAAIGVRVTRGATSHGLAFNVDPDLADYTGIVACGITDGGVCSLSSLDVDATAAAVARRLVDALAATLARPVTGWTTPAALDVDRAA